MKHSVLGIVLILTACFPSMQIGPAPHSIDYNQEKFNNVIPYFIGHNDQKNFQTDDAPTDIPDSIREQMQAIGFLEFRNMGEYKVFFCGYGVVGKGWGFIYGEFTDGQLREPFWEIKGNNQRLTLTYLERIEGKWYRFGAG